MSRSPRHVRGFTLVELLVVIGVIAILVAMLLPTLNRAREAAKTTACLSNLRQIGVAAQMYFNANKGLFPQKYTYVINGSGVEVAGSYDARYAIDAISHQIEGKWPSEKPNGVGANVLVCPNAPNFGTNTAWFSSYGFNVGWGGWSRGRNTRIYHVKNPTTKMYAMDWPSKAVEDLYWNKAFLDHMWHAVPGAGATKGIVIDPIYTGATYAEQWADLRTGRHNLKVNVVFMDGHAETLRSDDVTKAFHLVQDHYTFMTASKSRTQVRQNMFNPFVH